MASGGRNLIGEQSRPSALKRTLRHARGAAADRQSAAQERSAAEGAGQAAGGFWAVSWWQVFDAEDGLQSLAVRVEHRPLVCRPSLCEGVFL